MSEDSFEDRRGETTRVQDVHHLLRERLQDEVVLVVDDESHILRAISRLLSARGHDVITAANGDEALEELEDHDVSVILSDQRMPGMSGTELLAQVRTQHPNIVRVMITGNNDIGTAVNAINRGEVFRFISKPWDNDVLMRVVDAALDQHRLVVGNEVYETHIEHQNEELKELNEDLETRVEERTREVVEQADEIRELYDELEQSFDATIKSLLSIMELGSPAIIQHCQRTQGRVRMVCDAVDFDPDLQRDLERAALLHWIGLISAPDSLFKKGLEDLDESERASWEFHPLLGQQSIAAVPALETAGDIILHYLRKWSDPAFEAGVANEHFESPVVEEFLDACQILNICSTFERVFTVRNARGEKEAWVGFEEGVAAVESGRGTDFDPDLVDRFVPIVSQEYLGTEREEKQCELEELEPGMALARPLETLQGIPVAPRDMIITGELIDRLARFQTTNGLKPIYIWST